MTKQELIQKVAKSTGIQVNEVKAVIESTIEITKKSVASGDPLTIREFGTLQIKKYASKAAHNFHTNATIYVPERVVPQFKPSKEFKAMCNNQK